MHKIEKRKVTKDLCFYFKGDVYKIKTQACHLTKGKEVEIILLDNGEIRARCNNQWLEIRKDTSTFKSSREKKIIKLNTKWVVEKKEKNLQVDSCTINIEKRSTKQ